MGFGEVDMFSVSAMFELCGRILLDTAWNKKVKYYNHRSRDRYMQAQMQGLSVLL